MEGDLARRAARLPALLLALLGFAPELLFGQVQAQPRQVSGVLGGSVLLSPVLPPGSRVKEIEWSFSSGAGTTIQVAEFGPGGFERPDPQDRFKQRLEMPNTTALRIGALELGDSGVYGARIKLHPALVEDQSFNLSVYGGQVSFSKSGYIVLTLILLAVSLGGAFWCWRLNSEKSADPAATPTAPAEESPPEPQYTEIVHRSPPEGNDQGLRPPENNPEPTSTEKAPGSTVYEQIHQEPEDTAEEVT